MSGIEIWCVFSECPQCAEGNQYEEGVKDPILFGHLRAIVNSESDAKLLTSYYNDKYNNEFVKKINGLAMKHFYQKWKGNEP